MSALASIERTMNFCLDSIQTPTAKNQLVLYPAPGLAPFASSESQAAGRGLLEYNGRLFSVQGNQNFEVLANGTSILRGNALQTDANPATLTTNGEGGAQLFLSSGDEGYLYDMETNAFTAVVAGVTMVAFIDGFFIRFNSDTSTVAISDFNDGTVWNPLYFAQRSGAADPWRAMATNGGDLWLIGSATGEVWYNAGSYPFPFAPRGGLTFEPGIAAPFSLVNVNGRMTWLSRSGGGQGEVVQASGYSPEPISTPALVYAINHYDTIDDAVGMTYQDQGHTFYQLDFPTADATWLYDQTLGLWTERGQYDGASGTFKRWGPQFHAHAFGHHLVTGSRTGYIYRMSVDEYQDATVDELGFHLAMPMRRLRVAPGLCDERKLIAYDRFELYCETGKGLPTGQGSDPQLMLRTSRDGGRTWGSGRWRSAGKMGDYGRACIWNRCGSSRDMVFEVSTSDPSAFRLIDAFLTVREGTI